MAKAKKSAGAKAAAPARAAPAALPVTLAAAPALDGRHLRLLVVDARIVTWLAALAAAGLFAWMVRGVLVTLLFVAVLTFVGAPVVRWLQRWMPRAAAAGTFVVGALLALAGLLGTVLPPLFSDLAELFQALPAALKRGAEWAQLRFGVTVPMSWAELSSEASKELLDQVLPFAKGGSGLVRSGAVGVLKGAAGAASVIGQAFLVPVLAFFVLGELPEVQRVLGALVPRSTRPVLGHYLPLIEQTLSKLVRGQLLVASIMAVIYVVGLSIAGVPFALAIAVLSGAAYLVPFASGAVCLVLSAAFALLELQSGAAGPLIGAVVTVVVVQLVEGYVLTPRIVGAEAGLSPLAAVLAVLLGGAAAGFLGVVFALPAGAVIALVLREESRRRGGLLAQPAEAAA